jgi:hypothetical protein
VAVVQPEMKVVLKLGTEELVVQLQEQLDLADSVVLPEPMRRLRLEVLVVRVVFQV